MGRNGKPTKDYLPIDPNVREQRMISLAVNLAEKKLKDGTASSQIITHYLDLGTARASLERDILEQEYLLKKAKTEAIESGKRLEERYVQAIEAMKRYTGNNDEEY